ncbi:hypothetical protein [Salinicola peritrichatus]|uniref:hypothetical protein n=1 Tax=Salinicola peritrichatus TaxID=1267424 RepID=UPI0019551523|nr:hypothetical protein [Salinicola peritrichatus]
MATLGMTLADIHARMVAEFAQHCRAMLVEALAAPDHAGLLVGKAQAVVDEVKVAHAVELEQQVVGVARLTVMRLAADRSALDEGGMFAVPGDITETVGEAHFGIEMARNLLGIEKVGAAPLVAEIADAHRRFARLERHRQAVVIVDPRQQGIDLRHRQGVQLALQALTIEAVGQHEAGQAARIEAQLAALEA